MRIENVNANLNHFSTHSAKISWRNPNLGRDPLFADPVI